MLPLPSIWLVDDNPSASQLLLSRMSVVTGLLRQRFAK